MVWEIKRPVTGYPEVIDFIVRTAEELKVKVERTSPESAILIYNVLTNWEPLETEIYNRTSDEFRHKTLDEIQGGQ